MTLANIHKDTIFLEGFSQQIPKQSQLLIDFSKNANKILEIGFNGGHSAELFLKNTSAEVTSLDLGEYSYVYKGKEFIDTVYPNRHNLILGDSCKTVKSLSGQFDLIFIDGGHTYDIAKSDLINCKKFAHPDTIVLMDDIVFSDQLSWNIGPTRAWLEGIQEGIITETDRYHFELGRGMCAGKYKFI